MGAAVGLVCGSRETFDAAHVSMMAEDSGLARPPRHSRVMASSVQGVGVHRRRATEGGEQVSSETMLVGHVGCLPMRAQSKGRGPVEVPGCSRPSPAAKPWQFAPQVIDRTCLHHVAGRIELPPRDIDPASCRAKLSYRQAEDLFRAASGGARLHQLLHSALTHDAEAGTSAVMLMPMSGHTSIVSLARYARPSAEALQRPGPTPRDAVDDDAGHARGSLRASPTPWPDA